MTRDTFKAKEDEQTVSISPAVRELADRIKQSTELLVANDHSGMSVVINEHGEVKSNKMLILREKEPGKIYLNNLPKGITPEIVNQVFEYTGNIQSALYLASGETLVDVYDKSEERAPTSINAELHLPNNHIVDSHVTLDSLKEQDYRECETKPVIDYVTYENEKIHDYLYKMIFDKL